MTNFVHYQLNKNDALYTNGYSPNGVQSSSTISSLVEMKKGDRVFIRQSLNKSLEITIQRFLDIFCKNKNIAMNIVITLL